MNYYAINVKTGSEVTVAKKLDSLNRNMCGRLFRKIVVPFSSKTTIDSSNGQAYQRHNLLFNSYIFIQLEELTTDIYCLIKDISSTFKILRDPIPETEMIFLATGDVTEFIVEIPGDTMIMKIQNVFKEIINAQKNRIQIRIKNNRYLHINLPTNMAKSIIRNNELTVGDIICQPMVLLKGVLLLYEGSTSPQTHLG